jgi:L-ascorbate metabolism protein UlaG (beta-lactamase superfamily)
MCARAWIAIAVLALTAACGPYHAGAQSTHFDGERFFNPTGPRPTGWSDFWKWQLTREQAPWPVSIPNSPSAPPPPRVEGPELLVTFVGHATVLLQTNGLNVLTDPIWSERASPVPFYGPVRRRPPGVAFEALPKIDVVVVSHNHYDHLDLPTLKMLWDRDRPKIVVPLGNAHIVQRADKDIEVIELDWGQSIDAGRGARVIATPVQHWSQRGPFDRDKALWAGYVLDAPGGGVFFGGDTGLGTGWWIDEIVKVAPNLRLALLPIGGYLPRWFMTYQHTNPDDAVVAFQRMGARYALGIHFGTFPMADDGPDDALKELEAARAARGVGAETFRALEPGQVWRLD